MKTDILIIGAGIAGITLARRMAEEKNLKVLLVERRNISEAIALITGILMEFWCIGTAHIFSGQIQNRYIIFCQGLRTGMIISTRFWQMWRGSYIPCL